MTVLLGAWRAAQLYRCRWQCHPVLTLLPGHASQHVRRSHGDASNPWHCPAGPSNASSEPCREDLPECANDGEEPQHRKAASHDEIQQRIAQHKSLRLQRLKWGCPACAVACTSTAKLSQHMHRCCPDILDTAAWRQVNHRRPHTRLRRTSPSRPWGVGGKGRHA
jgi:hypothetical protein